MKWANKFDVDLFNSSIRGDLEGVKAALAQGGNVSAWSPDGGTPLLAAALNGHPDICDLLLAHGSNVNEATRSTKETSLHLAGARGDEATVEVLLSWGAAVNPLDYGEQTPLFLACQYGHMNCVLTLLKAGASAILPNFSGMMPIHAAATNNKVEIVKTLLEHGCSPDVVS